MQFHMVSPVDEETQRLVDWIEKGETFQTPRHINIWTRQAPCLWLCMLTDFCCNGRRLRSLGKSIPEGKAFSSLQTALMVLQE